jgi:hypothetical protein
MNRPLTLSVMALAICCLQVQHTSAQKHGSSNTITGTIFNCCDASSANFTLESDGTASAVYSNGTAGVTSDLATCSVTACEWALGLEQSTRFFMLTLTPVNGSAAGPFTGTMAFNGDLRSRCFDPSNTPFDWLNIQTQDTNCAMRVNFTYNSVNYALVMSPLYPGTGTATVTCTNWNGAACSAWTDVPSLGPNANVAHLYSLGKNGSDTYVGSYALTFSATLTHP